MSDILRDIVKATCSGQSQQVKDYLYEEMVSVWSNRHEPYEYRRKGGKYANQ